MLGDPESFEEMFLFIKHPPWASLTLRFLRLSHRLSLADLLESLLFQLVHSVVVLPQSLELPLAAVPGVLSCGKDWACGLFGSAELFLS